MGKWCLNPIYRFIIEKDRVFVKCSFTNRNRFELQGKNPIKIMETMNAVIEDGVEIEEGSRILSSLVNKVLLRKDSKEYCIYEQIYRRIKEIKEDYPDVNVQETIDYLLECSNRTHILTVVDEWGKSLGIEEKLPFNNITTYEYAEADNSGGIEEQLLENIIQSNSWIMIAGKNISQISRTKLEAINRKAIEMDCTIFLLSTDKKEENIKYGPIIKPSITGCIMCLNEIVKEKPFDIVTIEDNPNKDNANENSSIEDNPNKSNLMDNKANIIGCLTDRLGIDILYFLIDQFYDFGTNYTKMLGVELTYHLTHKEIQFRELTRNPKCTQC